MTINELVEWQKKLYLNLIDKGYKLNEIDALDIHYCINLLFSESQEEQIFIDDILS